MEREWEKLSRPRVEALDEILGVPFKVLDDGFVRVIDYMGSDESIVQAARVSYGTGTKKVREDQGLIRYLLRHRHTTPFEMCEIKLHVRVPMDTWRQWIRHRTANVNEYSTRYSVAIDAAQRTAPGEWRKQSQTNQQGSSGTVDAEVGAHLSEREQAAHVVARDVYEERLRLGVAREQARKDLPLSTYTEAYWKIDLHNLLHFLLLRMDAHAQQEIRRYANIIGQMIVSKWCPLTWQAFVDFQLQAVSFSRLELEIIRALHGGDTATAVRRAEEEGWLVREEQGFRRSRERDELEEKLSVIGLEVPWRETR